MKALIAGVAALFLAIGFCSCHNNGSGGINADGVPDKLIIGAYGGDNPGQEQGALDFFGKYLQKKLGIPVQFFYTTDYSALIEALRTKKIHMAHLTPFAYVIATQKPGLMPVATLGIEGKPSLYHSIIFTNPQTGLKTMDDVKRRAKSLSLCFADPASTSGHLIPRAYLNSIGLDPDSAFRQTLFAGSHAASILSVKAGKVDVGCSTSELALDRLIRDGNIKKEDIVTLWTSPPIVNDAITVRTDLNKDFIRKIQSAYFNAARDDYAAFSKYVSIFWPDPRNMGYVIAQDSMYNGLRQIAGKTKEFKMEK